MKYGDQTRLAEKLGISRQHVNDLIRGRKNFSWDLATRFQAAARDLGYKVSREELMDGLPKV